jgi:hypothetical protein
MTSFIKFKFIRMQNHILYKVTRSTDKFIYTVLFYQEVGVVGIVTGYVLDDLGVGVRIPIGSRTCSPPRRSDRLRPNQSPIKWIRALSQEVKWPGCEADHSLPVIAEVKKMWTYTSTPPMHLQVVLN